MVSKLHGTPLARRQGLCDIDRVCQDSSYFIFSELLLTIDMTYSLVVSHYLLAGGVLRNVKIFESS